MEKTQKIALIAIFGALHALLSFFPGVWRSLMVLILPLEGIILGPAMGFSSAFIGYVAGWSIRPRPEPFIFGVGEPIGALCAGLMARGKRGYSFFIYTLMLGMFFLHPITPNLPLWTLWDIYIAYICIAFSILFVKKHPFLYKAAMPVFFCLMTFILLLLELLGYKLFESVVFTLLFAFSFVFLLWVFAIGKQEFVSYKVAYAAFIGVEADVLTRIIILLLLYSPVGLYPITSEEIQWLNTVFIEGAFLTPIEAVIAVAASLLVGLPLLRILKKNKIFAMENFG
jgi:hypothetical protein